MYQIIENMKSFATGEAPRLLIAIAIAVLGWISAIVVGGLVRRAISRSRSGKRLTSVIVGEHPQAQDRAARWAGRLSYWVVILFALLGLLQYVELTAATEPITILLNSVFAFLPRVVGAAAIFMFAWILATLVEKLVRAALVRWSVDDVVARQLVTPEPGSPELAVESDDVQEAATTGVRPREPVLADTMAGASYWLTLLVFVPAILGTLGLAGMLEPARGMLDEVLGYVPNLGSAALIVMLGWFVARVLQRLVVHAFAASGVDRLGDRVGISRSLGRHSPSTVAGFVVYMLVLVPVAVAALHALRLDAVTAPASRMLETFLEAVPAVFGAALVLVLAYVIGRLVSESVRGILHGMGFDNILPRLGIGPRALGEHTPSGLAGKLAMLVIVVFAIIEGARMLALDTFADVATNVVVLGGHLLLGLAIFAAGLFVARLAVDAIQRSEVRQANVLATTARLAIMSLAAAVALRQMGLANEIIELAFGIGFGAVAIAAALAFGLGGREAASKTLEQVRSRLAGPDGASRAAAE